MQQATVGGYSQTLCHLQNTLPGSYFFFNSRSLGRFSPKADFGSRRLPAQKRSAVFSSQSAVRAFLTVVVVVLSHLPLDAPILQHACHLAIEASDLRIERFILPGKHCGDLIILSPGRE